MFPMQILIVLAVVSLGACSENLLKENRKRLVSQRFRNNKDLKDSNDLQSLSAEARTEDVPKYLPTGFHDFISSDQGPAHNYDATSYTPKFPVRLNQRSPNKQNLNHHQNYPSSYHSLIPSSQDGRYRKVSTYQWYFNDSSDGHKFPVPEDRLPPVPTDVSNNSVHQVKNEKINKRTRFERSLFGNKDNLFPWTWNKRSGPIYRQPQEFYPMMVDRNDNFLDGGDYSEHGLSSFLFDPLAFMVAATLPLSMILAAVLPILAKVKMANSGNANVPLVTTTATGNNGKTLINDTHFLAPIIDTLESFSPRNGGGECASKAFCKMVKTQYSTQLQDAILKMSKLVDEQWLKTFGMKDFMESMKDGNCDRILCSKS